MTDIPNLHEQVFVNHLRSEMNGRTSEILDSFSGWLLAGFGAASALLVSNYDSVSKHLATDTIKTFLFLFIWSLGLAIVQKYLSAIVTAHSQASAIGRNLGEKTSEKFISLNFEVILAEMERAVLPPGRWLVSRSFAKLREGDLVSTSRNYTRLLQIQGALAAIQAGLILIAVFKVASSFHA
jgi:hypothetical protein